MDSPPFLRPIVVEEARTDWQRDHGTWEVQKAHLGKTQERPRLLPEE